MCAMHTNERCNIAVGSADFLQALGARIDIGASTVAHVLGECQFGFLFAQMFHPAMKHVAPIRKQLGVPTVFNLLGPLTNPANPKLQVSTECQQWNTSVR